MTERRFGLIGGMSWESTRTYYSLLNELTAASLGPWHQPLVLVDSLDFSEIVGLQRAGDWEATGRILVASAQRLERGGATVLAITANTMHVNVDQVVANVGLPVIDIREAIIGELRERGATSFSLLGTKYVMEGDVFTSYLANAGVHVVVPDEGEQRELQRIIFDELTQGIVLESSRATFLAIAENCRRRGGEVVGLCCTEFGMLADESTTSFPAIDSTKAHVRALLASN
jgi:aspartate racemase